MLTANISAHKNVANNPHSQTTGILKKQPLSKSLTAPSCNPATFPGRLTLKSAFNSNCAQDDLSVNDQEKCINLLENYRKQVLKGDICAGDCPNDGISCITGVCRAHLRYMHILGVPTIVAISISKFLYINKHLSRIKMVIDFDKIIFITKLS